MKKRMNIIMAAVLTASMVLSAGSTVFAEESANEEKVKLVWFTEQMDDSTYEKYMKYLVTPFNESHPNIEVEISATPDYEQVLKVQLAGGAGPDICNMGGPTIVNEYVAGDKVLDLTEYVEKSGLNEKIFKWALDSCTTNGKIYALPNSYEALLLWYNVDMFEENGWTVPQTYEELEAVCTDAQSKGIIPIAFGSANFKARNEQWTSLAFCASAGRENTKKAINGELEWTDPVFVEAITTLNDMWQAGWICDKKSHAISETDANALFYDQSAAMIMTGTWDLDAYAEQIQDFAYDAVPFPSLKDGVSATVCLGAGGAVAINANTKYPDECWEFIEYMYKCDELWAQAVAEGLQPLPYDMDESLYPDTMLDIDAKILSVLEDSMNNLETSGFVMWTYWPAETRQYMMDNIENVWLGSLTVEGYLAESQAIFEKEFAEGAVNKIS